METMKIVNVNNNYSEYLFNNLRILGDGIITNYTYFWIKLKKYFLRLAADRVPTQVLFFVWRNKREEVANKVWHLNYIGCWKRVQFRKRSANSLV